MNLPSYVPILNAKQGEFDALLNTPVSTHQNIFPMFEFPVFSDEILKRKKYVDLPAPKQQFIYDISQKLINVRANTPFMFDIHNWSSDSRLENGESVLQYAFNSLSGTGRDVYTVVGYDRWEDEEYVKTLVSIRNFSDKFSIRLESFAFDDMYEDHFFEVIDDIIERLDLNPENVNVIIDLRDVTKESITEIQQKIDKSIESLENYNFKFASIAGCSLTPMINEMVPERNSTGNVLRREYVAWKAIRSAYPETNIIFGDYGIVSPKSADGIRTPHANGKIRHTIKDEYFIVRGHSRSQGNKGEQMYDLSEIVVNSHNYLGESFSWGDSRIKDCSKKLFKGNLGGWVAIDTNHHLQFVLTDVLEFERSRKEVATTQLRLAKLGSLRTVE
jgi:hypothetical protein